MLTQKCAGTSGWRHMMQKHEVNQKQCRKSINRAIWATDPKADDCTVNYVMDPTRDIRREENDKWGCRFHTRRRLLCHLENLNKRANLQEGNHFFWISWVPATLTDQRWRKTVPTNQPMQNRRQSEDVSWRNILKTILNELAESWRQSWTNLQNLWTTLADNLEDKLKLFDSTRKE